MFGSIGVNESFLGIDIGTTSIKAAELTKNKKGDFVLTNYAILETYGHLERFNNALQSSNLKLLDSDIISYLRLLVSKAGFKTNKARVAMPAFNSFTTLLDLPVMSEKEISQSINFQAKNYIPLPITTVTLDWLKVGEKTEADGTKKQQVLLIAIPNEQIEKYNHIFKMAGLKLSSLEIENLSTARVLSAGSDKPLLIIDIGGRSTSFSVATNGNLQFSGQTDFSSGSLTQSLATALNISARRADDLKRQSFLLGLGGERELSTIMLPIIDVILNEAGRVKTGFEKAYGQSVAGVVLAGSGANMKGLDKYVADQMKLPVSTGDPWKTVYYPPEIAPIAKELGTTLSVVVGLGLKNL